MNALIDPYLQISKVHGTPVERQGILYVPLYHPAAALHQQSLRDTLIADMRKVRGDAERARVCGSKSRAGSCLQYR